MKATESTRIRPEQAFGRGLIVAIIASLGVALAGARAPAHAQESQAPPPTAAPAQTPPADSKSNNTQSDELSEQPTALEAVGISLRLPKSAIVEPIPGGGTYRIDDRNDAPRYLVRVQPMLASAALSSPQEQFEEHLKFLRDKGSEFTILVDRDLQFEGARAKLAYLALPAGDGVTAVTGWLIIQTGPNTFVVFSIISSGVDFPQAAPLLDAVFATIDLKKIEEIAAVRGDRLTRGQRFLDGLTPGRLRAAADGKPRWYRVYRPGGGRDGADLELGYFQLRAFEGDRGDVSTSSATTREAKPDLGLMVEINAKMLVAGDARHTVDVQNRYWQAWDRSAESWSVVSTERRDREMLTRGQTGWRSPPPSTNEKGSTLTVVNTTMSRAVNNEEQMPLRTPVEWELPPIGYINQAEVLLLGQLLPRDGSVDGDLAFYWYDTKTNRLPQRIDQWKQDGDGTGRWTLLSRPSPDGAEIKQLFSSTGERLRRIDSDGLVTELIDHGDLVRLWRTKGLPTG